MLASLRRGASSSSSSTPSACSSALPLYSPLEPIDSQLSRQPSPSAPLPDLLQRHHAATTARPSLSRFLADFTLGFADGLTVPFALTAGLSSLGRTETVLYAGLAEICAGSISMGVGGYLSAKGVAAGGCVEEEEEEEKAEKAERTVDRVLASLDLPVELLDLVQAHVSGRVDVAAAVQREMIVKEEEEEYERKEDRSPEPWVSGLSVAAGYLLGGSLPLFPYFLVREVGDGLLWSFVVCVIALFSFGFTKDFVLHAQNVKAEVWMKDRDPWRAASWRWQDLRRSSWEGVQMVILGSLAALAAVLCVRLFEGMRNREDSLG